MILYVTLMTHLKNFNLLKCDIQIYQLCLMSSLPQYPLLLPCSSNNRSYILEKNLPVKQFK